MRLIFLTSLAAIALASCAHVSVDPIEVKTIHIVQDINLHIDQKLDEFFAYQGAATQPATVPATTQTANRGA